MNENDLHIIMRYLKGELEGTELEAFNDRLQSDEAFAKEVKMEEALMETMSKEKGIRYRMALKDIMEEPLQEKVTKERPVLRLYRRYAAAAAVILLLVALPFIYRSINTGLDNEALYASYYVPYDAKDVRSGGAIEDDNFQQALDKYEKTDYQGAIDLVQEILDAEPDNTRVHFMAAHCYLRLDNYENALASFEKVMENEKSRLIHEARWFMALIHLKNNELDQAKSILDRITSSNSSRKKEAEELLSDIQKLDEE